MREPQEDYIYSDTTTLGYSRDSASHYNSSALCSFCRGRTETRIIAHMERLCTPQTTSDDHQHGKTIP